MLKILRISYNTLHDPKYGLHVTNFRNIGNPFTMDTTDSLNHIDRTPILRSMLAFFRSAKRKFAYFTSFSELYRW